MIKLSYDIKNYRKDLLEIAGDGDTVIELGCHLGGTTKLLENCRVFAVDNSPEAVDVMNSLDNVTFISGDVRLHDIIAEVFKKVLEHAGVYKRTPEGKAAFLRFIDSL